MQGSFVPSITGEYFPNSSASTTKLKVAKP